MKQLKSVPLTLHEDVARYCLSALKYPLRHENGSVTVEYLTALLLWFSVGPCLGNDDDARVYEKCADRLFEMIYNENEESMHSWWSTYWSTVLLNYPSVAANHIDQLLQEIIDHKQTRLLAMLIVGISFLLILQVETLKDHIFQGNITTGYRYLLLIC